MWCPTPDEKFKNNQELLPLIRLNLLSCFDFREPNDRNLINILNISFNHIDILKKIQLVLLFT